jgi:hypothetical protein
MMGEFNLPAGSRGVKVRVLDGMVQCAKSGVEYTGDRKFVMRAGHRTAAANGQVQRGGKRKKKAATEDPWFHSDVA